VSAHETAKVWRTFVLDPSTQTETEWEEAQKAGLADRRTYRKGDGPVTHKWVLTDAGLDLMNAGK
jgi:hypothetical protein